MSMLKALIAAKMTGGGGGGGGADQGESSINITNPHVSEFVSAARSAYAGNDTVSIAANYKEAGTTPLSTTVEASGTVEAVYFDGKTVTDAASGTYPVKHFSPNGGRISLRGTDGNTEWSRLVQPVGTVRFLDLNATRNARDLGGWPCDGGTVKYGKMFRMTVPNGRDAATLLDRLGIRHQFDLRGAEGSQNPEFPVPHYHVYSGGVQYTKVITGGGDYDTVLRQIIDDVMDAIIADEPLLFHCAMGCDRTGTLAFYLEGILGMSEVDIDIEYELSSLFDDKNASTEYYYRYRTDNRPDVNWVGLKARVSGYSGSTISAKIISYLLSLGIPAAKLNAFRAAMIDGTPSIIVAPTYSVTNTLTNCATDNSATTTEILQPYSATISADSGYTLDGATVSVTMGGTDITASAYSNGTISIPSVTGALVITIAAAKEKTLKELFDPSSATINQRFSSSGAYSALNGSFCSDYIPVSGLNASEPWRIHIKDKTDATRFRAAAANESVLFCKSDKSIMNNNYGRLTVNTNASGTNTLCKHNDSSGGVYIDINQTGDGNFIPSTFFDLSQVAYIRVCMAYSSGTAIPDTADKILDEGGDEPTNLFDPNDADVTLRGRINSSGAAVAYADNQLVTGYISAAVGDVFTVETDKSLKTNSYTGAAAAYNSSKTHVAQTSNGSTTVWTFSNDDMTGTFTVPQTLNGKDWTDTIYVRFCVAYTDINNIKIYKQ